MKLNLVKLKVVFAVLFGTLLSISPFNPVRLTDTKASLEVCAAEINWKDLGTGVSCVPNYGACPGGENLAELITSMRFGNDINSGLLVQSLETAYGNSLNNICVSQATSDSIVRWMTPGEYEGSGICNNGAPASCQNIPFVKQVDMVSTSGKAYGVPRYCPQDWRAMSAPNKINNLHGVGTVSGCCPSTHVFVNVAEQSSGEALQGGICCKDPRDGRVPGIYIVEGAPNDIKGCYTRDEELIYPLDGANQAVGGNFATLEDALEAASEANIIFGIKSDINGFAPNVSYEDRNSPNVIKPQFGLGYGLGFPGGGVSVSAERAAEVKCPAASDCFFPEDSGPGSLPISVEQQGVNVFTASGSRATCERCFNEGEPVSVDSTSNTMYVCDPSQTGSRRAVPLCNSSVIDTVACLGGANSTSQNESSQGIESQNYDLCCQCREQGGVWTGIGCTDTTPSGLITGLIRIVYGVMGGVALVMLIYAGVMYQTGNEANVKRARETIIQTVTGLIVLTFSILILRIIGINVLDILPTGSI
jgi:hypothetical protein